MDRCLIEQYVADAGTLARAIAGLTREELNAHPVPGKWSVQELIVHLLESDLIASHRMKRIAAEERPLLIGYDETLFAQKLFYDEIDLRDVCECFATNRRITAAILRKLPDDAFERWGVHNERGKVTLGEMVQMYVGHVSHHMKFLREKRRVMGKPLAD